MNKWEIVHAYRRLAEQGKVEPWVCPMDGDPMVTRLGANDDPVLHCFKCKTRVTPGLIMYENMESAIKEFDAQA